MAKSQGVYLIAACCSGLLGLILLIVSFSTEAWVLADLTPTKPTGKEDVSQLNHGLFSGTYNRKTLSTASYTITVTCLMSEGVCAWSCLGTEEERQNEVQRIFDNDPTVSFKCVPISSASRMVESKRATADKSTADDRSFMLAGLWVMTIVFISLAVAFSAAGIGFNAYSIFYNPIEIYASPKAIYVYYSIAASSALSTLILWGANYGAYTSNDVAVLDTLTKTFKSEASLGWSYFILLPAEICLWTAMGLVYYREYILNKKDAEQVIKADDKTNDASTFMY